MSLHTNSDTVTPTGKTRDIGHGQQLEVTYSDGSSGWEHYQDVRGDNGPFFGPLDKGERWDFDGSNDTYPSLADAVDHYLIIMNDND